MHSGNAVFFPIKKFRNFIAVEWFLCVTFVLFPNPVMISKCYPVQMRQLNIMPKYFGSERIWCGSDSYVMIRLFVPSLDYIGLFYLYKYKYITWLVFLLLFSVFDSCDLKSIEKLENKTPSNKWVLFSLHINGKTHRNSTVSIQSSASSFQIWISRKNKAAK